MISAEVVADSLAPNGRRLTTFVLSYPRFIHAEFMTHRAFSRNAASSRAIPAKRIRRAVREDPATPIWWGANQKGMQAEHELKGWRLFLAKLIWKWAGVLMLIANWKLEKLGLHKQIANRIIEPWFNIKVVCTATNWGNFFALRNHIKAQPEIRALACAMLTAYEASEPVPLQKGEWHLPFVTDLERSEYALRDAIMISVARCARVSYMNHDGKPSTWTEDAKLFERLLSETPKHSSPAEHQGTPAAEWSFRSGNFEGWHQYRQTLSGHTSSYHGLYGVIV